MQCITYTVTAQPSNPYFVSYRTENCSLTFGLKKQQSKVDVSKSAVTITPSTLPLLCYVTTGKEKKCERVENVDKVLKKGQVIAV